VFCVVDMSLWIQVPVADFDGMIEMKIAHGAIIPFRMSLRVALLVEYEGIETKRHEAISN
jgi:hypothetical protein